MAFEANEYGCSIAAPGLILPDQPYQTLSRKIEDGTELEGGFAVWAKKGEDIKVWGTRPTVETTETDGTKTVSPDPNSYFLGIAQRIVTRDEYPKGTPVNVVTSGQIWVKVAAAVQSGNGAYITTTGEWGPSGTAITGVTYLTSATANGYAVIAIK